MATCSLRFKHSSFCLFRAITIIMAMVFGAHIAEAADANAAQAFVQQNVDRVNSLLDNPSISAEQRRMEFGRVLLSMSDAHRIAVFALGQYANGAMPEQLSAFQNSFTDYALSVYESRLDNIKGGRITVTGNVMRGPDDFVVNAEIARSAGIENREPIKIAFRVRALPGGSFVMTDMQFEGVWLALTERADFTAFLQQHGGDISALTGSLRTKTRILAGADTGAHPAG